MKNKYFALLLISVSILLGAVSCSSTPANTAPPPAGETREPAGQAGVDKAATDDLDAAIARANAARRLVTDFNGPALFPQDWQSAESLYSQAERQKDISTTAKARESSGLYIRAAEALEVLATSTLERNYQNMDRDFTGARFAAIRIEQLVPDLLFQADAVVVDADGKYKARDYYAARDTAAAAMTMYEVLRAGLDSYAAGEEVVSLNGMMLVPELVFQADAVLLGGAQKYEAKNFDDAKNAAAEANAMYSLLRSGLVAYRIREEIVGLGFDAHDPADIARADGVLLKATVDFSTQNLRAAREGVDEATLIYGIALGKSWEAYAADKSLTAAGDRQIALDLKANVALRQEFNAAQALYNQADAAFRAEMYPDAARLYIESMSMFEVISDAAREKRQIAEEALINANQRMSASDEAARNAERILEGGTR